MADYLSPTPYANPLTGLSNDMIQGLLEYMKDKQRTQQMQGLAGLLESTGIPKTVERAAYANSPKALLDSLTNVNRANVPLLKAETADALMNIAPMVGPAAKAAERGAMAAGRAGERLAERVVPQVMERGGLPAQLLGDLSQGSIRPMDVWHGSPHGPFQKFDPSKARTGEGNATFGEGAYLAQARGTGETYRDVLSAGKQSEGLLSSDKMSDKIAANTLQMYKTPSKAIEALESSLTPNLTGEARQATNDAIDVLKGIDKNAGYLYKVDLPDESIAKMLDYDKPLSKQAPEVQSALAELGISVDKKKMGDYEDALLDALTNPNSTGKLPKQPLDLTGEQILKELERNPSRYFQNAMEGKELTAAMINPRAGVSDLLANKGVPGVRYLDQMSRDAGDGTSNFVVFPKYQETLKIKEINDKPYEQWFPKTNLLETAEPKAAQGLLDTSYRGSHTAPNPEFGAPLHDLTGGGQMYPADVYSPKAAQYYGTGYPKADKEAFALANKVRGNPDAEVTMYRAVPKDASIEGINKGDWVTLSKDYAKNHGESVLDNNYKIISQKVKAKDLWTNADSIHEFGYWPE